MKAIGNRYDGKTRPTGLRYGILETTTYCQCLCPGCYMVKRRLLNGKNLDLKTAVHVLDLCRDYLGNNLETMDLLGGDPLLWPCLKDYVGLLLKRGIKPWIFTNMIAITPELARWLKEREVNITGKLNVDPGDPEQLIIQAALLGRGKKTAEKMIAAINVFLEARYRDPLFRLQNLIRQANIGQVPEYYRWCLKRNVGTDLELMGSGEAIGPNYWEIAPNQKELALMIKRVQEVRQEFDLAPAEVLMPHVFGSCPFYDKGLYFAVDGSIRACSNSTVTLSRLEDSDPISKALSSEVICNRLKLTQSNVGEPCHSCAKWEKCRGGCRATAEGLGNPFGGYPLCPVPFLK